MNPLGDRIKNLRKKHNLSQAQLAEFIGVVPQFISQIENAKRKPRDEKIEKLANFLILKKRS